MAYTLSTWNNNSRKVICVINSVAEAEAEIRKMFTDMFIEEDSDNLDHFDVFAYEGIMSEVFAIEPILSDRKAK